MTAALDIVAGLLVGAALGYAAARRQCRGRHHRHDRITLRPRRR